MNRQVAPSLTCLAWVSEVALLFQLHRIPTARSIIHTQNS